MNMSEQELRDRGFMLRALALARRAGNATAPNPNVGAVVVSDNRIVGRGWHQRAGEAHAEVIAIENAGEKSRGATLYVTLEPCNHHGRTPPCVEKILSAGIARVVYSVADPNPDVEGGGGAQLVFHGVSVTSGCCEALGKAFLRPWLTRVTSTRPFVTLKLALSRDGMIAAAPGSRTAISGAISRAFTQRLRSYVDAICVGSKTIEVDDPILTNRSGRGKELLRIVFDSSLSLDPDSKIFNTPKYGSPLVFTTFEASQSQIAALNENSVDVLIAESDGTRVSISSALGLLAERGVVHLLVEGGAELAQSFLNTQCVDEVILIQSPHSLGAGGVAFPAAESLTDVGFMLNQSFPLGIDRGEHYLRPT